MTYIFSSEENQLLEDVDGLAFDKEGQGPATVLLNDIASRLYPDQSFRKLVESIGRLDKGKELAQEIGDHGIQFKMISCGDRHTASGYTETETVGVCTEEWYLEATSVKRLWGEIKKEDEVADEIREILAQFEWDICEEVKQELDRKYGFIPTNNQIGSLLYQRSLNNPIQVEYVQVEHASLEKEDNIWWGKVNGELTPLVFLCEEDSYGQAWFSGLRPTNALINGDRLHVEV